MKTPILLGLALCLAMNISACGDKSANNGNANTKPVTGSTPGPLDAMTNARLNFGDNCALCHKVDGSGGRITIKGERLNVPSLSKGHALKHTDKEVAEQIADGGDGMPQFKDKLTGEQIKDLVAFIRKEFQGGAAPPK
ncbi:MAG: cytochrome c [Pyrinomonadaceae bacterium]